MFTQTTTTAPKPQPTLADLFRPLQPDTTSTASTPIQGQPASSGAATEAPQPGSSGTAAPGTVTVEELLSSSKHTEISSTTGQTGPAGVNSATGTPGASVNLGGMVQGEWVVNIVDALLPALIVGSLYAAGMKIRKSEMQLTAGEKATLAPLWQKCLDSMLLNFDSPWSALALTMAAIYGGKVAEKGLVAWVDKKQEKQQAEVLKAKIEAASDKLDSKAENDYTNQSMADIIAGKVITPADGFPFTEDDVRKRMETGKMGRAKAIEALKKKYKVK